MSRLKNEMNIKDRKTQMVMTSGSIVYRVPLGPEAEKIGHFVETEITGDTLIVRFATKRADDTPALRIENKGPFTISFE